jgi:hypothetical protein
MRGRSPVASAFAACGLLISASANATEFFVDPSAAVAGDGSAQSPWQTLEQVVGAGAFGTSVKAGDTVWLRSGYHGALALKNGDYAPPVTIAAMAGQTPTLSRASFAATKGLILAGVSISPSFAGNTTVDTLVTIDTSSARITVKDCELYTVKDASAWGAAEWITSASSGVSVRGTGVTIRNNTISNVRFGISVDGADALVDNNRIVNFSADGLRGLGDNGVFQYNLVKNVYVSGDDGDDNHDDGFQSWSVGADGVGTGVVKGVVLRGNVFINREDPNQKLTNSMQGIGCFDGMFDGWVVENNVVITDHWHGISFYGMTNSRIVNNTVIDVNDAKPGPPWIMVTAHKDGTPSSNVVVRNNLATDYDLTGTAIAADHNTTLTGATLASFFVSPTGRFDVHLLPTAPAIDTGSADQAPMLDADGIPRPQGTGLDLGAYEWHSPDVVSVDGGVGASGGAGGQAGSGGTVASGGNGAGGSSAVTASRPGSSGCGCGLGAPAATSDLWVLALLVVLGARRWRRSGPG